MKWYFKREVVIMRVNNLTFLGSLVGRPACRQAGRPPLFLYDLSMYYVYVIKSEKTIVFIRGLLTAYQGG
jgi:hypothetical protein